MVTALSQPKKHAWLAVRFTYGNLGSPTYARYTDFPSSVVGPDGALFTSRPTLGIEPIKYSGAFQETPVKIKVDRGAVDSFTDQVSSGEPHSPIKVDIWEIIDPAPSTLARDVLHLFRGDVQIVTKNPEGHTEIVEIAAVNLKGQLDVPLGLLVMPHCVWTFTGPGCQKTGVAAETGTLTAKDSTDKMIVTITGLSGHSGKYWHRGYVEVAGLRISIRDWASGNPTTFMLVVEPPERWVGASVSVFPGCDKSIATCRTRWSNEEHFGGFGFAIPAYHPVVEDGT